ncbi:MAG: hypothetical protein HN580_28810 [Deltaproteobacteria bacterium]|jgi:hypothetical protein|nr:hypothetical protein [Deltaproteobacteria bacterium]MBT4088410.1 hypothetical protein [Deltaproteobacteria bacterium]MBT4267328.1 hypothetical protein [Deltaproteobacteria bacterium]MBT4643168.1 hypothetical protein [Deltaproteobacteria bacterium]MBT6500202.1 hypothetical protein [Deltaproteobacteria bacterium]
MIKKQATAYRNIEKVIALCNEMIELADLGDDFYLDDDSGVFYSALRDSAYKIRRLAKNEMVRHESGGKPSS